MANAQELKGKIAERYGSLDDERGCYVSGEWLSIRDIVDLIDECDDGDELKDRIEERYGSLDNEIGCYVGGEWLSVRDIVDLIDECGD